MKNPPRVGEEIAAKLKLKPEREYTSDEGVVMGIMLLISAVFFLLLGIILIILKLRTGFEKKKCKKERIYTRPLVSLAGLIGQSDDKQ